MPYTLIHPLVGQGLKVVVTRKDSVATARCTASGSFIVKFPGRAAHLYLGNRHRALVRRTRANRGRPAAAQRALAEHENDSAGQAQHPHARRLPIQRPGGDAGWPT